MDRKASGPVSFHAGERWVDNCEFYSPSNDANSSKAAIFYKLWLTPHVIHG